MNHSVIYSIEIDENGELWEIHAGQTKRSLGKAKKGEWFKIPAKDFLLWEPPRAKEIGETQGVPDDRPVVA